MITHEPQVVLMFAFLFSMLIVCSLALAVVQILPWIIEKYERYNRKRMFRRR